VFHLCQPKLFSLLNIKKANGHTKALPCDSRCPRNAVTNPVVFMNKDEDKLYVYSGMQSDSATFADNQHVYIYDIDGKPYFNIIYLFI
jgi:hypothetical protein